MICVPIALAKPTLPCLIGTPSVFLLLDPAILKIDELNIQLILTHGGLGLVDFPRVVLFALFFFPLFHDFICF